MDIQYFGANCLSFTVKGNRFVVDENLNSLGLNSIMKPTDVALYTSETLKPAKLNAKLVLDCPGEYEVADISIIGIPARAHMDEENIKKSTIYKIAANDLNVVLTGHIYPKLTEEELERIGLTDVLFVPIGGNGYTIDPLGALTLIKAIEPKLIVPTHYSEPDVKYEVPQKSLEEALKEMSIEPKDTVSKLKVKASELGDLTQLIVLKKS